MKNHPGEMGDFGFVKDLLKDLREKALTKTLDKNSFDQITTIFTGIDSQIFNLERYIENESRKKVLAEEKVQHLESDVGELKSLLTVTLIYLSLFKPAAL